jgi:hypothetical protein
MGTTASSPWQPPPPPNSDRVHDADAHAHAPAINVSTTPPVNKNNKYKSFPGSAILEKTFCGSIDTTDPSEYENVDLANRLLKKADIMCVSSPDRYSRSNRNGYNDNMDSPEEVFFYEAGNTPHHRHHGDDNDEVDDYSDNDDDSDFDDDGDDDINERKSRRRRRRRSGATTTSSHAADPSSALLARALVNEVTNNPKTMKPAEMALREYKLLKAQKAAVAATKARSSHGGGSSSSRHNIHGVGVGGYYSSNAAAMPNSPQAVGAPGVGVGPPNVLNSLAFAVTGDESLPMGVNVCVHPTKDAVGGMGSGGGLGGSNHNTAGNNNSSMMPPGPMQQNRAAQEAASNMQLDPSSSDPNAWIAPVEQLPPHTITLGISVSRRHATVGHKDTVTRQTAFDLNELQDRSYKYVSSTDEYGWRAGGGESGERPPPPVTTSSSNNNGADHTNASMMNDGSGNSAGGLQSPLSQQPNSSNNNNKLEQQYYQEKIAAPDTVHIPIIQIPCRSEADVDQVIHALASGDIFIPHMAILPEILSVNGISPPDLVVRFGCERNDDLPPDEWPNWCLEFMHNQLYEYFYSMGAKWTKRPFSITLARKVKWKTVKHMNRYFAHAERVIETWRQKGPQMLDPQLSYIEGGASPEEVARPHGIYLMRSNGVATNYFCPNFDPPYTTKMTRSLLENVLNKSWDRKRREWTSDPIPRLVTPNMLLAMACGCTTDPTSEGFMAKEVTMSSKNTTAATKAKQEQLEAQLLLTMVTASSTHSSTKKKLSSSAAVDASIIKPPAVTTQQQQQGGQSSQMTVATAASSSGKAATATPKTEASSMRYSPVAGDVHIDAVSTMNSNGEISVMSDIIKPSSSSPPTQQHLLQQQISPLSQQSLRERHYEEKKMMDDEPPRRQQQEPEESQIKISPPAPAAGCKPPTSPPSNNIEDSTTRSEFGGTATSVAAASQFGAAAESIATSTTTVMHTNVGTTMTATRTVVRKQRYQQLTMINSKSYDEQEDEQNDPWKSVSSPSLSSSSSSRKGKSYDGESVENANPEHANTKMQDSKKVRDMLELERKRQDELLSQVRSDHSSPDKKLRQQVLKAAGSTSITYVLSPTNAGNTNSATSPTRRTSLSDLEGSDSGQSMEYSQDGSSAYMTTDGASTLVGQNFAGDQSVLTMTSRQSSAISSSHGSSINSIKKRVSSTTAAAAAQSLLTTTTKKDVVESEIDSLSIQESSSSVLSIVPTDEELFSIGWAKALDPNSGNYYYFTLDRKNIVWDNPLNPSSNYSMGESTATQ